MRRVWGVLFITVIALIAIQNVRSADTLTKPAEVQEVTVTGEATGSITSVSLEESAKQKQQVPGGFTIKNAYSLVGFRAGFRRSKGFSIFLDCKNLINKRYASSIDTIADARTNIDPEIFHPGDGRGFYGGVSWTW